MSKNLHKVNALKPDLIYEEKLWQTGKLNICGIDEVGRGPLAGPVMACAVVFKKGYIHPEVTDSKLLSAKKRQALEKILIDAAIDWKIGFATAAEIDAINIRQATFLAMHRAINALRIRPDYAIVDGEGLQNGICPSAGIVKGDQKSFTIAAASIIAKETRDRLMINLSHIYPAYGFERNKGYGTKEHIKAIIREGASPYHRKTFLKKIQAMHQELSET